MKPKSIGIIFGWTGRLLTSATVSKGIDVSFAYNADGIRTSKTSAGGVTTRYFLDGSRILGEARGGA